MSDLIRTDNSKVIAELQAKNDALVARVGMLENLLSEATDLFEGILIGEYKPDSFTTQPYRIALVETPTQSLQRIQAEAIEKAVAELYQCGWNTAHGDYVTRTDLEEYANQLRQQGKDYD